MLRAAVVGYVDVFDEDGHSGCDERRHGGLVQPRDPDHAAAGAGGVLDRAFELSEVGLLGEVEVPGADGQFELSHESPRSAACSTVGTRRYCWQGLAPGSERV